jgi:hypothetical protein
MTDIQIKLEAMRIVRQMVKQAIRERGVKISSIAANDITAKAKAILADSAKAKIILRRAKRIVQIRSLP